MVDAFNGGKFISPSPSFGCFKFNFAPRFSKARNKKATKHTWHLTRGDFCDFAQILETMLQDDVKSGDVTMCGTMQET